jgi:hypothetical protein
MAQGGNKGKKAVSLREKKDAANNAALAALSKEAGEYNSMVSASASWVLDAPLLLQILEIGVLSHTLSRNRFMVLLLTDEQGGNDGSRAEGVRVTKQTHTG